MDTYPQKHGPSDLLRDVTEPGWRAREAKLAAERAEWLQKIPLEPKVTVLPYMGPHAGTKPERKSPFATGTGCTHTKAHIPPEWAE